MAALNPCPTSQPKRLTSDIGQSIGQFWLSFLRVRLYTQAIMPRQKSAKEEPVEAPSRIEPARVEDPTEAISDVVADLSASSATWGERCIPARPPVSPASCAS
jgi:hypothetical protein